mmetsp:Transcript_147774/g.275383  ORF Transcript_147774/g.275383 Transcript_147774/m.275383 type:complete len:421 (+) Transcript_147774:75-1337(+)
MDGTLGRSPTFLVGATQQQHNLEEFQRRDQHLSEQYSKNKPLCFNANTYQLTHPRKAAKGCRDADAALTSPMLLGVADGVSQIEDFGIDASALPKELLKACEELAMYQLFPEDQATHPTDAYMGPVCLMKEAYEATESMGSTTALLAILDNSTQIHGKLHPMVAVLSIGDCELLIMRRLQGRQSPLQAVFHTEMQRIGGHAQQPIQIARVDDRIDPDFDESCAIEVIERGSAAHYVSAYEGDIVVLGSDGVFDNLYLDEVVEICNEMLSQSKPAYGSGQFMPTDPMLLGQVARRIVEEAHLKTAAGFDGRYADTPIGKGGKVDDTCCVVGEVVEWTAQHSQAWTRLRRQRQWNSFATCGGMCNTCCKDEDDEYEYAEPSYFEGKAREYPYGPAGSSFNEGGSGYGYAEEESDDDKTCSIS